jgi:hypothetical protein
MSYKKYIEDLALRFPNVKKISVDYYGAGDSFESFNDLNFETKEGEVSPNLSFDYKERVSLLNETEMNGLLWDAIEKSGADFNNDGSRGYVHIDLENTTLEVENYYIVQSEELGGGVEPYIPEEEED